MKNLFKLLIASATFFFATNIARAEVLFEDNFDSRPDWQIPYTVGDQACSVETSCPNLPSGYYGYYVSKSVISPLTGSGLKIDNTNKRGDSGKGVTFWDQTHGIWDWTSDLLLSVEIPPQKEIYLRYYVKFQPDYINLRGGAHSIIRKFNHISHYVYNGKPFTFFTDGGFFPTTINGIKRSNGNLSNIYNTLIIRPEPDYNGAQTVSDINATKGTADSYGVGSYSDLPNDSLPIGNVFGTGTEYNSPGMFGDGNWHSLEFYLKNNSAPGVADGEYKFWMDGYLQTAATGFVFRQATSTLPDEIWNMIHVGGNAYNPFLGDNILGEQWYAVDDLVISNTYVGPDYVIGNTDTTEPAAPTNLTIY